MDSRLNEKIETAKKALSAFDEALGLAHSNIVRDAAIQRFEFTLEALWKLAQRYLMLNEGLDIGSPKGVARSCLQVDLLTEQQTEQFLKAIDDRNLTVHTYDEELAERIYKNLFVYQPLFHDLVNKIENKGVSP